MTPEDKRKDALLEERLKRHFATTKQPPRLSGYWLAEQVRREKQNVQIILVSVASGLWVIALLALAMLLYKLEFVLPALSAISFLVIQGLSSGVFAWFYFYRKTVGDQGIRN